MTPKKTDNLREWDAFLTVETAFWEALVREPAFQQVRKAARGKAGDSEHVSVTPDALSAARERLRLPSRFDDELRSLLRSPASATAGKLPSRYHSRTIGGWVPQLEVNFTIDYAEYSEHHRDPRDSRPLPATARTLTEAKRIARQLSEQAVEEQWRRLGLPDRPRRRNDEGELASAGRRLAKYLVGERATYASIAAKEGIRLDTVKKSVQLAARALGIDLRHRPPVRARG